MFSVFFPYGISKEIGDVAGLEQGKGKGSASLPARTSLATYSTRLFSGLSSIGARRRGNMDCSRL
jgi:hypothetical protein